MNKSPYLLTCIDHFLKYVWTIPIKNKEVIIVWNAIAQVFIQGYPEIIQSDNGREFVNRILHTYLICINVRHVLGSPYHSQSQGFIDIFNKTVQKSLSVANDNEKQENLEWNLELNLLFF